MRIKGGALYYVIVVSVVIVAIITAFLIWIQIVNFEYNSFEVKEQVVTNAYSGIQIAMAKKDQVSHGQYLKAFLEDGDSVFVKKDAWLWYDVITCRSHNRLADHKVSALCGSAIPVTNYAIHLNNDKTPLGIAGNVAIDGDIAIGRSGWKHAYIGEKTATDSDIIGGSIKTEDHNRNIVSIDRILNLENRLQEENVRWIRWNELESNELINDFDEELVVLEVPKDTYIDGLILYGNVILYGKGDLVIGKGNRIENAIIWSESIVLEEDAKISAQLLASDSIRLKNESTLEYPSTITLFRNNDCGVIHIEGNASVLGDVFALNQQYAECNGIIVENEARVEGQIYADCPVQIQGEIIANVSCPQLYLKTNSGIYKNHLMDVSVQPQDKSDYFIHAAWNNQARKLIAWL